MPFAEADGARLYFEETGEGEPLLFVHEFAGDHRSWEPQLQFFARRYHCVAHNARGYPPSDVPRDAGDYDQARQADDIAAVMDHLGIGSAHVVGLSMGAFATLHFGLRHPARARSLFLAGIGSGAPKGAARDVFIKEAHAAADILDTRGWDGMSDALSDGPTRIQLKEKSPRAWGLFKAHLEEHSAEGSALTLRGYQAARPSLYDLEDALRTLDVPVMVAVGDEDAPCIDASVWLKRVLPSSGLWISPRTGHCMNLEEPADFNARVLDFITAVEQGRWRPLPGVSASSSFGDVLGEES